MLISIQVKRTEHSERLNDAEKRFLIDAVSRRACLWDDQDANYKSLNCRTSAWRGVSQEMETEFEKKFDCDILQKTFKNLRDVFTRKRRECQEILLKRSGASAGQVEKITSWPFYASLLFLDSSADQGERYCNVTDTNVDQEYQELVEEEIIDLESVNDENSAPTEQDMGNTSRPSSVKPITALTSKKRKASKSQMENITATMMKGFEPMDKFEAIGVLLAAKLRELNALDPLNGEEAQLKAEEMNIYFSRLIFNAKNSGK
ncbi:unnamed protein product [Cylicostephanus goldi]|uniref:MADF domain-containing protein n=1 Tax=Cylicostephanus goldi TaxID=71465 RepID=A0A3P6SVW8_CYLGO|nr:unnamed protein product [Cylicostephanus goldi]